MPEIEIDILKLFKTADELHNGEDSIINGKIPSWVKGSFVRVGPGKFDFINNFTLNHWLDGYALLSKFDIEGSHVKFYKKFLQSDAYKKAEKAQKPLITEFGTKAFPDPSKSLMSRFMSALAPIEMTDNDSMSLFRLGSELFVTSNTNFFRKIDSCSLSTGDKYDYHKCFGLNGVSVHPLTDENGDIFNIGFSVSTGFKYNIVKILGGEKYTNSKDMITHSKTICSIPSRWTSSIGYFHSFGLTKNYIIFIEQPYAISMIKAAKAIIMGDTFKDWLEWKPNEKSRFFLIQKNSGKVIRTEYLSSEPFFFLHVINCFEDDENKQLIVDLTTFSSPSILDNLYIDKLRSKQFDEKDPPMAQRFILPLIHLMDLNKIQEGVNLIVNQKNFAGGAIATIIKDQITIILQPEIMTESGLELPVINSAYIGKTNKYFYATGSVCQNYFSNSICKVNTLKKETILWRDKNFYFPGEPTFIANPNGNDEDDGVIISAVTSVRKDYQDFILFLDAKNWTELGRAYFKADIPQAMHGIFIKTL